MDCYQAARQQSPWLCAATDYGAVSRPDAARAALSNGELRERIYAAIGRDELNQALNEVRGLVRPPNNVFYTEREARKATVLRFLPTSPASTPIYPRRPWLRRCNGWM